MGDVIVFDLHAGSLGTLKPKTSGLISLPFAASASRKRRKFSEGISPRERQLLTADGPTPTSAAAPAGPPTASITSSTEQSMSLDTSRNVKLSSVHEMEVESTGRELPLLGMVESNKSLATRLKMTRTALGVTPTDVCKRLKIGASAWSQYENGDRRITLKVAIKFCDEFGLTLDWIYRADPSRLPNDLRLKMREAA